jgi:hypothetical protein
MVFVFLLLVSSSDGLGCQDFSPKSHAHVPSLDSILERGRSCCAYYAESSESGTTVAPAEIPHVLLPAYTLWGKSPVLKWYFNQIYAGSTAATADWNKTYVDQLVSAVLSGTHPIKSNYPGSVEESIDPAIQAFPIRGLRGCVIGSENPWLEAVLLARGASHITTIEYGRIRSTHPQIDSLTPDELRDRMLSDRNQLAPFDFCFAFSSIEHSGLGRYGDHLAPFGDFESIARVGCLLRDGGLFYNGLPTSEDSDCLVFNAHRIYGPLRLGLMLRDAVAENNVWQSLGRFGPTTYGCSQGGAPQPVHVWKVSK